MSSHGKRQGTAPKRPLPSKFSKVKPRRRRSMRVRKRSPPKISINNDNDYSPVILDMLQHMEDLEETVTALQKQVDAIPTTIDTDAVVAVVIDTLNDQCEVDGRIFRFVDDECSYGGLIMNTIDDAIADSCQDGAVLDTVRELLDDDRSGPS